MKRVLILFLLPLVMLFSPHSALANDINKDNFREECRIGSIGVLDSFNMEQLNNLFGSMTKPAKVSAIGINHGLRRTGMTFANAHVVAVNDELGVISVTAPIAVNGEALGTPRGIVVGHDLDTVFRLYGTPVRVEGGTANNPDYFYRYGTFEYGILFKVDADTNKVTAITVYVPTC